MGWQSHTTDNRDCGLARSAHSWNEFEILQKRFLKEGVPTVLSDPRDLVFENGRLIAQGQRIDLLYRRVLINDIIARPDECSAMMKAYESGAVCMTNALTCKIPHKKSFFARGSDRRAKLRTLQFRREGADQAPYIRGHACSPIQKRPAMVNPSNCSNMFAVACNDFVLKPSDEYGGTGVHLGWENTESEWDAAFLDRALTATDSAWVVQERIKIRREIFPMQTPNGIEMRDMLVDFAPYIFRGKMAGCLTRLSSTSRPGQRHQRWRPSPQFRR